MLQFSQLEKLVPGSNLKLSEDRPVTHLLTDSRKPVLHEGSVFFAIRGEHHDGHKYVDALYESGIRQFVIEKGNSIQLKAHANYLTVNSSVEALQKTAVNHRSKFSIPVVGITGSNGKTIIKEWLYQLLQKEFSIVKNPGSYNSQIGVPLSVWQIQAHHSLGIFEAGISKPGEMEKLEEIIKPTIGIFTNIGSAHDENFSDVRQKIAEKIKLFRHAKMLICCEDHTELISSLRNGNIPLLTWGFSQRSDIQLEQIQNIFSITWKNITFDIELPFSNQASVENAFHCITLMLHLGIEPASIKESVHALRSIPMRLELKEGINQCQIMDDTYNNDLGGLQISLDFLSNQHQKNTRTLILSDVLQSGLNEEELVDEIVRMTRSAGVNKFVGIGSVLSKHAKKFLTTSSFYKSTEEFLTSFDASSYYNEIILVKGARSFQFEKIVSVLQRKVHGTVMEVDLGALVHNLNYFKSKLNPGTRLMVMVKAFAYGSGSVEVANVLQYHRVDYLGVAYADEGVELRKNNITLPIMVMNPSEEGFSSMVQYDLEPEIYGFRILNEFISFLNGRPWKVHIKIDTGMHRLGFNAEQVDELIRILGENKNLTVASIFTHLAGSDEAEHDAFSREQAAAFMKSTERIVAALGYKPILHVLNTPGILRLPEWQLDMIRLGIGLYGVDPTADKNPLKPVATLKTVISQVREVKEGESIGYGRKGRAIKDMKVGTIAVGYADGYSRAFSRGVGEVLVKGKRAAVVGNVCMDMTMIDVTGLDVKEGDEVILFGEALPIHEIAEKIKTIPYEILTNTSERVKRIFVAESI